MVIIACLISNGYDVLACNSLDPFEKTPYMLPESSAESIEVAQKNITERLGSKQILFDFDEILYETNEDGLCHQVLYLCHAYQWTNQAEDNSYGWIEVRKLINTHWYVKATDYICCRVIIFGFLLEITIIHMLLKRRN